MIFTTRIQRRQRQQGNTAVGVVIGLVVGLVIAVIVALAITKGATPFTDHFGKTGKSAEATAEQATDPNKPLYGNKEAARAAAKQFTKDPNAPAAEDGAPGNQNPELAPNPNAGNLANPPPAVIPAAPVTPERPVIKPETALTARMPASTVAKIPAQDAKAGDDKYVYYLQAGAYREMADAETARAKLALLGFEAAVTERISDSGVLHRVRMGPFNQVEAMNRARSKLSENGVDVAVVRNQK